MQKTCPDRYAPCYVVLMLTSLLAVLVVTPPHTALANSVVTCDYVRDEPQTEAERLEREQRDIWWQEYVAYSAMLPAEPDTRLRMPVSGVRVSQVADTWGAPRGVGRRHEGQDIFAPRGTPIYSATEGYLWRIGTSQRGGLTVWVVGPGGRRYYYAHLERYGENIREGDYVTTDTIIGYVGNTGNAVTTPPHLHFGVYYGSRRTCNRQVFDPLPLLVNR
ncbi:MAG: M23 family metallopeptidase [Trueperaceae bacterium]|nr:M23 family metallopeptidase [Trueperaceae bacterium]